MTYEMRQGHVLDLLAAMPEKSVQCCVTSPPYWGLRSYKTDAQVWGGDLACDHEFAATAGASVITGGLTPKQVTNAGSFTQPRPAAWRPEQWAETGVNKRSHQPAATCTRCGAWRGELGSEPDPESFIAHLVTVFRAVWRVLADDGCLFVNIGDSYAGSGKGPTGHNGIGNQERRQGFASGYLREGGEVSRGGRQSKTDAPAGYKAKDLIGTPWMLAFALRADGWYLRQDIIWAKPNPMPESVRDRCTRSHEYLFLLTKRARYYWDADAMREGAQYGRRSSFRSTSYENNVSRLNGAERRDAVTNGGADPSAGRNRRSVWTIPTQATPDAHFATYPERLVEPCVRAASKPGDTVLDPFAGSGTTLLVADRLGRHGVGLELNPEYVAIAERRLRAAKQPKHLRPKIRSAGQTWEQLLLEEAP